MKTKQVIHVPLDSIQYKDDGLRAASSFTVESLLGLILSINTKGQREPIKVRKINQHKYRVVDGYRRYWAMMAINAAKAKVGTIAAYRVGKKYF